LVGAWPDGRIKLAVIATLLEYRGRHPELFAEGGYNQVMAERAFQIAGSGFVPKAAHLTMGETESGRGRWKRDFREPYYDRPDYLVIVVSVDEPVDWGGSCTQHLTARLRKSLQFDDPGQCLLRVRATINGLIPTWESVKHGKKTPDTFLPNND